MTCAGCQAATLSAGVRPSGWDKCVERSAKRRLTRLKWTHHEPGDHKGNGTPSLLAYCYFPWRKLQAAPRKKEVLALHEIMHKLAYIIFTAFK